MTRERTLEELRDERFDLLVVGAGIVGSRVAYEASRAGLRVALVDAGDIGGATSSSSSKLVHGGLRYLATGDFSLVRQLQCERRVLAMHVAPHLLRPLPLLIAVTRGQRAGRSKLALALGLYSGATGFRGPRPAFVARKEAAELIPSLDARSLATAALMAEAQTHDGRLTVETAKAAARYGAVVANYVSVRALHAVRGRIVGALLEDGLSGGVFPIRCRAAVNAAGPWVDEVRRLEAPRVRELARLSKGVQVLLPLGGGWRAGVALLDASRTAFVTPWQGMLLVGVTDTPHEGRANTAAATAADVAAVLEPFAELLPELGFAPDRVRHVFVGLRVLPSGVGDTAAAPRRHAISVGPGGLVSVVGGKLTTHRLIAADALCRLPCEVRPRGALPTEEPLQRPRSPVYVERFLSRLDPKIADHLSFLYGHDADRLLAYEQDIPDALDPIHADGPDVWAQAYYAVDHEWAVTVDDVVARRTTVGVRGLGDEPVRAAVERLVNGSTHGVALDAYRFSLLK